MPLRSDGERSRGKGRSRGSCPVGDSARRPPSGNSLKKKRKWQWKRDTDTVVSHEGAERGARRSARWARRMSKHCYVLLLGNTDRNSLPWPGTIVTICVSCLMTGNKPPPTGTIRESSKGDTSPHVLPTSQNLPAGIHPG